MSFVKSTCFIICLLFASCGGTDGPKEEISKATAQAEPSEKVADTQDQQTEIDYQIYDQQLPSDEPVVFAPGIVSTGVWESAFSISPDGSEFIFNRETKIWIAYRKADGSGWTEPEVPSFSNTEIDGEASYAPDGSIVFNSRRPMPGAKQALNLWRVEKTDTGWGLPVAFGSPVNDQVMHAACMSESGNVYASGLIRARHENGQYLNAEKLNPDIVGRRAYMDPQERFILFDYSPARGQRNDIYLVTKNSDDSWDEPIRLNDKINTTAHETNPYLSNDGRLLFFTRNEDIYWVSAEFLKELTPLLQ